MYTWSRICAILCALAVLSASERSVDDTWNLSAENDTSKPVDDTSKPYQKKRPGLLSRMGRAKGKLVSKMFGKGKMLGSSTLKLVNNIVERVHTQVPTLEEAMPLVGESGARPVQHRRFNNGWFEPSGKEFSDDSQLADQLGKLAKYTKKFKKTANNMFTPIDKQSENVDVMKAELNETVRQSDNIANKMLQETLEFDSKRMKWVNKMLDPTWLDSLGDGRWKVYDALSDYYPMKTNLNQAMLNQNRALDEKEIARLSQGMLTTDYPVFDDILYPEQFETDTGLAGAADELRAQGLSRDAAAADLEQTLRAARESRKAEQGEGEEEQA